MCAGQHATNTPHVTDGDRETTTKLADAMTRLKKATAARRAEVPGTPAHHDALVAEERLDREVMALARAAGRKR